MTAELRQWVTHYTEDGSVYRLWEKPVPRIPDPMAECSVFLYNSERAAKEGQHSGGSGFLVHVPSQAAGYGHLYAVTNKHIVDNGFHVLRLTKKTGGIETVRTTPDSWVRHPRYDVAVNAVEFSPEIFRWWSIATTDFITEEIIRVYNIGLGDEAFLVGRLVVHAGRQKNAPVARFGNVSLMVDPSEPIKCEGYEQPGFLVECRSLSGFSGSPVFVETRQEYEGAAAQQVARHRGRNFLNIKDSPPGKIDQFSGGLEGMWMKGKFGPWLLGIDWGHIPLWRPVYDEQKETQETRVKDRWVQANTGIACVLPAWYILETLNDKELMKSRQEQDTKHTKQLKNESVSVNDAALEPSAQPFSKDDFETALKKASRKMSSEK